MHLDSFTVLLAQAGGGTASQPSPFGMVVPMVLIVVIMYFMLIRPQQQTAKRQAKLLEALKKGDRVVTASGVVGIVITIKEKAVPLSVLLQTADSKLEVTKSSITEILEAGSTTES